MTWRWSREEAIKERQEEERHAQEAREQRERERQAKIAEKERRKTEVRVVDTYVKDGEKVGELAVVTKTVLPSGVERQSLEKVRDMPFKQQASVLKSEGLIPKDAIVLPSDRGISYLKDKEVEKFKELPVKYQRIAKTKGIEVMNKAIEAANTLALGTTRQYETLAKQHEESIKKLEPYKVEGDKYNLVRAILEQQISKPTLDDAFGGDAVGKELAKIETQKRAFLTERTDRQNLIIGAALTGRPKGEHILKARMGKVGWGKLPIKDKAKVLEYYANLQPIKVMGKEFEGASALEARLTAPIPIVGTVANWSEMSTGQRVLNSALDAAFVLTPFLAPRLITYTRGLVAGSKNIPVVQDIVRQGSRATLRALNRMPGTKELVKPLKVMTKRQTDMAKNLVKIEELKGKASATRESIQKLETLMQAKKATVEDLTELSRLRMAQTRIAKQLLMNREQLVKTRNLFHNASKDYVNIASRNKLVNFDDPLVQRQFMSLGNDVEKATQVMVDRIINPRTVKVIKLDLARAEKELATAKLKWPTEPNKWSDITHKVLRYEGELLAAQSLNISKLQQQLAKTRVKINDNANKIRLAEGKPKNFTIKRQLRQLRKEIVKAKRLEAKTAKQIDDAVRAMQVEWGKGGFFRRGGGRGVTPDKPLPSGGGRRVGTTEVPLLEPAVATKLVPGVHQPFQIIWVAPSVAPRVSNQLIRELGQGRVITKPKPEIKPWIVWPDEPEKEKVKLVPIIVTIPDPTIGLQAYTQQYNQTQAAIQRALKTHTKTQPYRITSTGAGVGTGIKPATTPATSVAPLVAPALAQATEVTTTTPLQPVTPTPPRIIPVTTTPPTGKPPPPPPPIKKPTPGRSDVEKRERIKKSVGAVTWNMGKLRGKDVWHTRLDTGEHLIVLGEAPKGAKILADGPGSAYKTTQRIRSTEPFKEITQRHGIVKATIKPTATPKGAKAQFTSVQRGRQFFTKVPGGTAISRKPIGRIRKK